MDYLHILCMVLMVLSCVLCTTLMLFIYVYYVLFICTNLVDVMPLFFTGFSFNLPFSAKIAWFLPIFRKNCRFINEIGRLIIKIGRILVLQISTVPPLSPMRFGQFFKKIHLFFLSFLKTNGIVTPDFPCSTEFSRTGHCHWRHKQQDVPAARRSCGPVASFLSAKK
jgi:hypothetical protein